MLKRKWIKIKLIFVIKYDGDGIMMERVFIYQHAKEKRHKEKTHMILLGSHVT
jgi:hypothetical protein